jgi:uncharacterized protein (DUF1697 family)
MVAISMLRGVNLGSHHRIRMDVLRAVYESLGLRAVQTYVQSGNVIFQTKDRNLVKLAQQIADGIEKEFGFRPAVIVRTSAELRQVIVANPFAKRKGIEPSKLLVTFLAMEPSPAAGEELGKIKADPEELHLVGREIYIYFPNGMGRSKLPWARIDKAVKTSGTGRNWNTVTKLLDMAEKLEAE